MRKVPTSDDVFLFGIYNGVPCVAASDGVWIGAKRGREWRRAGLKGRKITATVYRTTPWYAGTDDGLIFRSPDQGETWEPLGSPVGKGAIRQIVSSETHVFVVSSDGRLYRAML